MASGMEKARRLVRNALSLALPALAFSAEPPSPAALRATGDYVPAEISGMVRPQSSELRELVERFVADRDELKGFYTVKGSELQIRRLREFYVAWRRRLDAMAYDTLGTEGRIDWILLSHQVAYEEGLLERQEARNAEMAVLVPFAGDLARLQEARRLMEPVQPEQAAATLDRIAAQVAKLQEGLEAGLKADPPKESKGGRPG